MHALVFPVLHNYTVSKAPTYKYHRTAALHVLLLRGEAVLKSYPISAYVLLRLRSSCRCLLHVDAIVLKRLAC